MWRWVERWQSSNTDWCGGACMRAMSSRCTLRTTGGYHSIWNVMCGAFRIRCSIHRRNGAKSGWIAPQGRSCLMETLRRVLPRPHWGLVLYRREEAQRREGREARPASHEVEGGGGRVSVTGRVDEAGIVLLRTGDAASGVVVGEGARVVKATSPATPSKMDASRRPGG